MPQKQSLFAYLKFSGRVELLAEVASKGWVELLIEVAIKRKMVMRFGDKQKLCEVVG